MKLTPVPIPNDNQLKEDVTQFSRKLRLREFFFDTNFQDESIVNNKSEFSPQPGRDTALDQYIGYINRQPVGKSTRKQIRSNLNKKDRTALNKLRNNYEIVIKEADKGDFATDKEVKKAFKKWGVNED